MIHFLVIDRPTGGSSKRSYRLESYPKQRLTGSVVGATVSTLFYPMNVIKTHMQLKVGGSFLRFTYVLTKVLKERGFKGMWQDVHINYSRSFISWGIINATYELVSDLLH